MGKYEVTRGEWEAVMGPIGGPAGQSPGLLPMGEARADTPIGGVDMPDAKAFCARLSAETGDTYRLPTVDEWRYACKAGAQTRFPWGDAFDPAYAWGSENAEGVVHPVGQKKPNAFGLYDMIGNVREICAYDPNDEERRKPWRMGGSVGMSCDALPEVLGFPQHWGDRDPDSGFRVVREVP